MTFYLAEVNIARMLAPLDSPVMADFVAALDSLNALAENTPGFVWRLKSDDGNDATSLRPYEDDYIIVNLTVWEILTLFFNMPIAATMLTYFGGGGNGSKT